MIKHRIQLYRQIVNKNEGSIIWRTVHSKISILVTVLRRYRELDTLVDAVNKDGAAAATVD